MLDMRQVTRQDVRKAEHENQKSRNYKLKGSAPSQILERLQNR